MAGEDAHLVVELMMRSEWPLAAVLIMAILCGTTCTVGGAWLHAHSAAACPKAAK